MKVILKGVIAAAIVISGWIAYWGNRPPDGEFIQVFGAVVILALFVLVGVLWAINEIISDED